MTHNTTVLSQAAPHSQDTLRFPQHRDVAQWLAEDGEALSLCRVWPTDTCIKDAALRAAMGRKYFCFGWEDAECCVCPDAVEMPCSHRNGSNGCTPPSFILPLSNILLCVLVLKQMTACLCLFWLHRYSLGTGVQCSPRNPNTFNLKEHEFEVHCNLPCDVLLA